MFFKKELEVQRQVNNSLRQDIDSQRQEVDRSRKSRHDMHVANLLRKATEKVMAIRGIDMPQGENDPKHSRYAQAVRLIKCDRWEDDTKSASEECWKMLQQLPRVSIPKNAPIVQKAKLLVSRNPSIEFIDPL